MSIPFSDTVNNTGIVQQARAMMRVDANQWPTWKIANSANHWLDFLTGYALEADKNFQWDNTQHTDLPEGTVNLTSGQSDYSFLTDENGNSIITLTGVSILQNGAYKPLTLADRKEPDVDVSTFGQQSGVATKYDKIADNIIRLDFKPASTVSNGLKFFFQRSSPRFTASDTTKTSGFSPLLDRGFVISAAYDGALTLGLNNLAVLAGEKEREKAQLVQYFHGRNNDLGGRLSVGNHSCK